MISSRRIVACATTALALGASALVVSAPADAAPTKYSNCKALNEKYPHGVGRTGAHDHVSGHSKPVTNFTRNTKVYEAQSSARDRDHDGIACEKA